MRARRRGSKTYYYYDTGAKPRHEIPLGFDYILAVQEWAKLLTDDVRYDRMAISRRASELRAEGMTLKEIGFRLSVEGFKPKEGGVWYPSRVKGLIQSSEVQESSVSAE